MAETRTRRAFGDSKWRFALDAVLRLLDDRHSGKSIYRATGESVVEREALVALGGYLVRRNIEATRNG